MINQEINSSLNDITQMITTAQCPGIFINGTIKTKPYQILLHPKQQIESIPINIIIDHINGIGKEYSFQINYQQHTVPPLPIYYNYKFYLQAWHQLVMNANQDSIEYITYNISEYNDMMKNNITLPLFTSWDVNKKITVANFAHYSKVVHYKERTITPALHYWSSKMNIDEGKWKSNLQKLSKLHYKYTKEVNELYELQI
ncbi:hypothetical protein C6P40_004270, partial [Pichia californica]